MPSCTAMVAERPRGDVMAEPAGHRPSNRRGGPEVVAPTTRVNIALPFSQVVIQEPVRELPTSPRSSSG